MTGLAARTEQAGPLQESIVGKQTLAEQLPPSELGEATEAPTSRSTTRFAATTALDSSASPTTPVKTWNLELGVKVPFDVPLPENLREQIQSVYDYYRKTSKVQDLSGIRYQVHVAALVSAVPMDPAAADELVQKGGRTLRIDGREMSNREVLAWLVGLAALPARDGKRGIPKRTVRSSVTLNFDSAELAELRGKDQTPTPQVEPSQQGWLEWGWGIIIGDFNEDPSLSQIVVNGLLGLIPVVDTGLDIRDVVANLYQLIGLAKYDQFEPWFNFVCTIVGCVPEAGTVIKTIAKGIKWGIKKIPLDWALRLADDAPALLTRALDNLFAIYDAVSTKVVSKARTLLLSARQVFEQAKTTATSLVGKAKQFFDTLIDRVDKALAQLGEKVAAALRELKARLLDLADTNRAKAAERTTETTDTTPKLKTEARLRLEKRFMEVFGESVRVYRGIRVEKNGKVLGTNGAKPQMVTTKLSDGKYYGKLGQFITDAERAKRTEVVVVSFIIKVDHVLDDSADPDLMHMFLRPDVDITTLPGYRVELRADASKVDPDQ